MTDAATAHTAPVRKLGLLWGSFDPIHHGHLILAREAFESLGLDCVIFIPAGVSPHKMGRPPAPAGLRCQMVAAAIRDEAGFEWDDCEIQRPGPSFAIDTVRHMGAKYPGAEIFYFIGEDNLAALHTWKDIGLLQSLVKFVVLARKTNNSSHGFQVIARSIDISSTDIRNRIARGLSVRYLVPESACEIISKHRLYRND